jgi:hypothetical protein
MKLAELIHDPDRLIRLPPSELGRRLLPVLAAWPHNGKQLQLVQFLPRAGVPPHQDYLGYVLDHHTTKIADAIHTAWACLVNQTLLIPQRGWSDGVFMLSAHAKRLAELAHINIFISYRRCNDDLGVQALYSQLKELAFAADQLFMDVDNIPAGTDFADMLKSRVAQCEVMLVVIGERWLEASDKFGKRRLDDLQEFVRIEIESGLTQGKLVIPVLLREARMPQANELPASLRPLATRNAVRLRHERFADDVRHLIESMQKALEQTRPLAGPP